MSLYDDLHKQIATLRAENERDWLTGVLNRGAVEEQINHVLESSCGILILVDINNFHRINNKYGHLAGDRALQQLAALLSRMVLKSDIIGRIGGDEFIIFIRGDRSEEFIIERTKQIRERVLNEVFPDIGSSIIHLSFGWALYEAADTYEKLFQRAEQSLIRVHSGSNNPDGNRFEHSIAVDSQKIRLSLQLPGAVSGALYQDFEHFEILYHYIERTMKRTGRSAFILLLTLADADGSMPDFSNRADLMRMLGESIRTSLRVSDVYTQYSSSQYLIMNVEGDMRYSEQIAERIRQAFYRNIGENVGLLLHESYPMKPASGKDESQTV